MSASAKRINPEKFIELLINTDKKSPERQRDKKSPERQRAWDALIALGKEKIASPYDADGSTTGKAQKLIKAFCEAIAKEEVPSKPIMQFIAYGLSKYIEDGTKIEAALRLNGVPGKKGVTYEQELSICEAFNEASNAPGYRLLSTSDQKKASDVAAYKALYGKTPKEQINGKPAANGLPGAPGLDPKSARDRMQQTIYPILQKHGYMEKKNTPD